MKNINEMVAAETGKSKEMTPAQFKKVDFRPLLQQIKKLTGVAVTLDFRLDKTRRGMGIAIDSPEYITKAGLMKAVFKSVRFDSDYGTSATSESIWINLHMNWQMRDGGSNGGKVMDCWYDVKKKAWTFR